MCDELITRPEESYRLWCVVVCDLETSRMRRPWPALGSSATETKNKQINILRICTLIYYISDFNIYLYSSEISLANNANVLRFF